ncbi:MAG: Bug family tripartite tricarboxylate transporter substrate binding protein [Hyphomicrobiaceae bacterium]
MTRLLQRRVLAGLLSLALTASAGSVFADPVADFYKGRQISIIVAHTTGTGYDTYARVLARHMGRHIPGSPTFVVHNIDGASGITGTNRLFHIAEKDGSVIGVFIHSVVLDPFIGKGAAKFDPSKFEYIGNMEESISTCTVWETAPAKTLEEMRTKEVRFGASSVTGSPSQMAAAMKNLLGAKINLIHGYRGVQGVKVALERDEVQGICALPLSTLRSQWATAFEAGKLKVVAQLSGKKGAIPNVPYAYDFAKTEQDRQVFDIVFGSAKLGKLVAAPPGVPQDRLKALRAAFDATMKDKAFLAEAGKARLDITPASADEVQAFIKKLYATPKDIVARARKAVAYVK